MRHPRKHRSASRYFLFKTLSKPLKNNNHAAIKMAIMLPICALNGALRMPLIGPLVGLGGSSY
jgi:hypothetical protein